MKISKEEARQLFYEYLVRVSASVDESRERLVRLKSMAQSALIGFGRARVDHRGEIDIVIITMKMPTVSYEFEVMKRGGEWALWLI